MVHLKYSECKKNVNPLKFVKAKLPACEVYIYEGEQKYLVSENFCTCMDFLMRKLAESKPCKHICTLINKKIPDKTLNKEEDELKALIVRVLLRGR